MQVRSDPCSVNQQCASAWPSRRDVLILGGDLCHAPWGVIGLAIAPLATHGPPMEHGTNSTPRTMRPAYSSQTSSGQSKRQATHSLNNVNPPMQRRRLLLSVHCLHQSTWFRVHSMLLLFTSTLIVTRLLPLQSPRGTS